MDRINNIRATVRQGKEPSEVQSHHSTRGYEYGKKVVRVGNVGGVLLVLRSCPTEKYKKISRGFRPRMYC